MVIVGEGMPKSNTGGLEKGDLYVVFSVDFPTYNSETYKKLQEFFPKEHKDQEIQENKEEYTLQVGHYRDYAKPSINKQEEHGEDNEPHVQQCTQS
jgi:DnaJ-class molecular chaperone